jgi:hypothetical protein
VCKYLISILLTKPFSLNLPFTPFLWKQAEEISGGNMQGTVKSKNSQTQEINYSQIDKNYLQRLQSILPSLVKEKSFQENGGESESKGKATVPII